MRSRRRPRCCGRARSTTGPATRAGSSSGSSPHTLAAKYAVAVANGTVALELALYASVLVPGDEVITTSRTFIASASCVVMRGATPVIADVDRDSQNITAETIRAGAHAAHQGDHRGASRRLALRHGSHPRAGAPARKLKVIEDCAQAHGARYKGRAGRLAWATSTRSPSARTRS